MNESWELFRNKYKSILGNTINDFEFIVKNPHEVADQYISGVTTLTHGDLHTENILFHPQNNDDLKLID